MAMIAEHHASNQLIRRYVHGPGVDEPLVWMEHDAPGGGSFSWRWPTANATTKVKLAADLT